MRAYYRASGRLTLMFSIALLVASPFGIALSPVNKAQASTPFGMSQWSDNQVPTTTSGFNGGCLSGFCSQSDPQWAIGGYSHVTGVSTESTSWANLAASYNLGGVNFAMFMINVPFSAQGTVNCPGEGSHHLVGFMLQGETIYGSGYSYPHPGVTLIMDAQDGLGYYTAEWNINLGSGTVTETIQYKTLNGITGWWFILAKGSSIYDLMVLSASSDITLYDNPVATESPCDGYTMSLSSLGTTSSLVSVLGANYLPSVSLEVSENDSGTFLAQNSNVDGEANVGGQSFFTYGVTGTQGFNIGANSPPNDAYGSGVTYTPGAGSTQYYDEFGALRGITNWMSTYWFITNPVWTRTINTTLPSLNSEYYLTMQRSGSNGVFTPPSGRESGGTVVPILAEGTCDLYPGLYSGSVFDGWTGQGSGSYTGFQESAYVTMNSNVIETANFIHALCPQIPIRQVNGTGQ